MALRPIFDLLDGVTRFGRFTVLGEGDPIQGAAHPARRARCRCDCGNIRDIQPAKLKRGTHRSCGCLSADLSRERFTKHGGHSTREYASWRSMIQRCHNPKSTSFNDYGARGITVCQQWQGEGGYLQFVADMGPRPKGKTLDRIDSNGNYEPGNVRWATPKRQQNNRRCSKFLSLGGVTRTQREWTDALGWGKNVISERLKAGWPVEKALTTPVEPRKRRAK